MPTLLDQLKIALESLDVRDFRKKKIWRAFEYFKTDRKKGVKVSIMLGYSGYEEFIIDVFGVSIYFKSIENARNPLMNKYHFVAGDTTSTLTHSFMDELEGCELKITQPEHIEILVNKVQSILNEKVWTFIDQYSNIEEVAKEIASKKRDELPFNFSYPGPQAAAMNKSSCLRRKINGDRKRFKAICHWRCCKTRARRRRLRKRIENGRRATARRFGKSWLRVL